MKRVDARQSFRAICKKAMAHHAVLEAGSRRRFGQSPYWLAIMSTCGGLVPARATGITIIYGNAPKIVNGAFMRPVFDAVVQF